MTPPSPPDYSRSLGTAVTRLRLLDHQTRMILRHIVRFPLRAAFTTAGVAVSGGLLIGTLFFIDSMEEMIDSYFNIANRHDVQVTLVEPRSRSVLRAVAGTRRHGRRAVPERVEAAIVTWKAEDVLKVPVAALFRRGGKWAVFRIIDGAARLTTVSIGRENGEVAQVLAGLEAGESVILYPGEHIGDGVSGRAPRHGSARRLSAAQSSVNHPTHGRAILQSPFAAANTYSRAPRRRSRMTRKNASTSERIAR